MCFLRVTDGSKKHPIDASDTQTVTARNTGLLFFNKMCCFERSLKNPLVFEPTKFQQ